MQRFQRTGPRISPTCSHSDRDRRDRGAVLPLVLVLVVIGSLVVLPVLSYATTVMRANTVLSAKTQRFEAVKAGLRTSLYDPLELFRECDQQGIPKPISTIEINGVPVDSTCQIVGLGNTVINDYLRYGLAVTEAGATIPPELKGKKFQGAAPADWRAVITSTLEDNPDESRPGTIWLPNLPSRADSPRSSAGHTMPPAFGGCRVYFPGTYADDLVLSGPTFFTSGIYYFGGEVRIEGGADVTVGDGRTRGCATSQEAVFYAEPPLDTDEAHNITGFGASWIFGGEGRLVVSNDNGQPVELQFNRRYVDNRATDPSLYVAIASVNGDLDALGGLVDYVEPGYMDVPKSQVQVDVQGGVPVVESPLAHGMLPSVFTDVARLPAAPVNLAVTPFRSSELTVSGNNGTAYLTWAAPPPEQWGGLPIERYEVYVDGSTTPACTVPANALHLECLVTGMPVGMADTSHSFSVRVFNAFGPSPDATVSATYRNGLLGLGGSPVHAAVAAPTGGTVTRLSGAARVTWNASTLGTPSTPISHYTVTAARTTSPTTTRTCSTLTRTATGCHLSGLGTGSTTLWNITVQAHALNGATSAPVTVATNFRANGTGSIPNPDTVNPAPPTPVPIPAPPATYTEPIIDFDLAGAAPATIDIPGYVAVPQGTVRIENTPAHPVQVLGGILAARMNVTDGRVGQPECTTASPASVDCVDLGFKSQTVQLRLRIESSTPRGSERSVAVVQINENGAFTVNSWEVQ